MKHVSSILRVFFYALITTLGIACSSEDDAAQGPSSQPQDQVQATIGAQGGELTSADGRLTLRLPPGAVAKDTLIGIAPAEDDSGFAPGLAYQLTPDGLALEKPGTLTLTYTQAFAEGDVVLGRRLTPDMFEVWPTSHKVGDLDVEADIDHFSVHGGILPPTLQDLPVPLKVAPDGSSVKIDRTDAFRPVERAVNRDFSVADSEFSPRFPPAPGIELPQKVTDYLGGTETACTFNGVNHWPCGAMYWYRFKYSRFASRVAYFAPPGALQDFEVKEDGPGALKLSWTAGDAADGNAVVERLDAGGWQVLAELPYPASGYKDVGLTKAGFYNYRLHSKTASGTEGPSVYAVGQLTQPTPVGSCEILVNDFINGVSPADGKDFVLHSQLQFKASAACTKDLTSPTLDWYRVQTDGTNTKQLILTGDVAQLQLSGKLDLVLEIHDGATTQTVTASVGSTTPALVSIMQLSKNQLAPTDSLTVDFLEPGGLTPVATTYPTKVGSIYLQIWTLAGTPAQAGSLVVSKGTTAGSSITLDFSGSPLATGSYFVFGWVKGPTGDVVSSAPAKAFQVP